MIDSRDQDEERGSARMLAWMLLAVAVLVAVAVLTSGCGVQDLAAGADVSIPGFGSVFQCDVEADTPTGLAEWCWKNDDLAEFEALVGATCQPTPRHAGPCIYRCPGEVGCNAFSSCWCAP